MQQPLVSIIIPCYNAERYVAEAIESALQQTYRNHEVIVIDDGSTDDSLEVIQSFGGRIRWESGPNRGACAARNRGLAIARGEWVQFLDADDLLHREKLARQVPHCLVSPTRIVSCRWTSELMGGGAGHLVCQRMTHSDPVVLALRKTMSTPAPLYPRSALEHIGRWNERLTCAQDYDLNLRLACTGYSFHELPDALVTVRRVPGSISDNVVRVLNQTGEINWRVYRRLREQGALSDERAEAFAAKFTEHGRAYLRYGLKDKAAERFRDARMMHPSGGLRSAYQPWTRVLRGLVGPRATEMLVQTKRRLVNH